MLGALASLALIGTVFAVAAPLVAKRLRARAPTADADAVADHVESAVTRGLEQMGSLAAAYAARVTAPLERAASTPVRAPSADSPPAALPDRPTQEELDPGEGTWEVPATRPFFWPAWPGPPLLWRPLLPRPPPWRFHRPPLFRRFGHRWR